jgi:hypothetical protein
MVFVQPVEIGMIVARTIFPTRYFDGMVMRAIGLGALQQADMAQIAGHGQRVQQIGEHRAIR